MEMKAHLVNLLELLLLLYCKQQAPGAGSGVRWIRE